MINSVWVKWDFNLIWLFCNILNTRQRIQKGVERQDGGYLDKRRRHKWKGMEKKRGEKGFIDYLYNFSK